MSPGLAPSEGSGGESVHASVPAPRWLPATHGIAWFVDASLQFPPSSHGLSLCVCVPNSPLLAFIKILIVGFRAHPKSRMISPQDP